MKYIKLFEAFTEDYMKKIDLKDFKKIKKGAKPRLPDMPAGKNQNSSNARAKIIKKIPANFKKSNLLNL